MKPLDCFVVMGAFRGFDIPLAGFEDGAIAIEFAQDVTVDDMREALSAAWRGELSEEQQAAKPLGVLICEFVDGTPQPFRKVKDFE